MRPLYLTISGWGPYKDLVEIDFEKIQKTGLFLITGPTGAGKTTIFDAISYALYGNLSGDMREKGTVRSDFAGADVQTFVKLRMEHGGKVYNIERNPEYMRPKKRKSGGTEYTKEKENAILIYPDGKAVEGIKEVNAKLLDILVLDYNQFKQISMLAQGQFSKLLNASPKEKVAIFREIFGTHIYDRFTVILRSKVRALEEKDKAIKNKLEEALQILADRPDVSDFQEGEQLREWLGRGNIHYGSVLELLTQWQKVIAQKKKELEGVYEALDAQYQEMSTKEQAAKELNRKFDQLTQVKQNLETLKDRETQMEKERWMLIKAMSAAEVRVKEVALIQAGEQLLKLTQKEALLQEELMHLQEENKRLEVYGEHGSFMESYLDVLKKLEQARDEQKELAAHLDKREELLQKAREEYLLLEQERDNTKKLFEAADKAFKRGMVGIVATTMLEAGQPCPVCGSVEHPHPASKAEDVPTEQQLEELKDKLSKKEAALSEKHRELLAKQMEKENLSEEFTQLSETEKKLLKEKESQERFFCEKQVDKLVPLETLTLELVRAKQNRLAQMAGLISGKEEEVRRGYESISEAAALQKEKEGEFFAALQEKGFVSSEEYEGNLLSGQRQEEIQNALDAYQRDLAAAKQLNMHLSSELEGKQRLDETDLATKSLKAKEERESKRIQIQNMGSLLDALKETKGAIKDKMETLEQVETEYGYVKDLEALASGKNSASLVFEQYVLAGYFDEILSAANLRFSKMTGGRYEMARMEEVGDARSKDSLEIEVMDYYTGKARPIKTLSGGESFKASLSLALGLSDVIQAMSGGIKVDVLFVDEGFGALDGESLDQACETMQSLVEHNRMIGIISHVQELRERISNQIVVERGNGGSTVKINN